MYGEVAGLSVEVEGYYPELHENRPGPTDGLPASPLEPPSETHGSEWGEA